MAGEDKKGRILSIYLMVLLLSVIPFTAITFGDPVSRGGVTGCPESMPPPVVKGNRTGDWKITCDVVVEETTIKLRGNITVDFGGSLTLGPSSTVEQDIHDTGPYRFVVYNQASLTVEEATLRTDHLMVYGTGDVFLRDSTVRVRGGIQAAGGLFELSNSILTAMPDAYGLDPDVNVNISAQAVFIRGSTVEIKGHNAPPGNATTPPGDGGDARGRLLGQLVTNLSLSVLGGFGGRGWDQVFGNGHDAGDGGDADFELHAMEIKDLRAEVSGGDAGKGGNGAESLNIKNGGHGGDGGDGGDAILTLRTGRTNISDTTLSVTAGKGGGAGHGGKTKGGTGGNGGLGGEGGEARSNIEGENARLVNTGIDVTGGIGGSSGRYGPDLEELHNGNPGRAGPGGGANISVHYYYDLDLVDTDLQVRAGDGLDGAVGWQFGSNGGSGGNASMSVFAAGGLTFGPTEEDDRGVLTVMGGNAGDGGEYEGGTGEQFMGRAGRAGSADVEMDILGIADIEDTDIIIEPGSIGEGRNPISGEKAGHDRLVLSAVRYNVTSSTSTTPFEGLRDNGLGWLVNTQVEGGTPAYVWPWEENAEVKVWWDLQVNMTPMLDNQKADITIKDADHPNDPVVAVCTLRGGWDKCTFFLLGEMITHEGQFLQNYTAEGTTDDGIEHSPLTFYLAANKLITLVPGGNFYAPHVNLTYPGNGDTFTVEDLAAGVVEVHGTAWEDIRDEPTWVQNVEVSLMDWQTRETFTYDMHKGVNITPLSSSVSRWTYFWDLTELVGYTPLFKSGAYRLCARAFDGEVWSDDEDQRREGGETCINIALFQVEGKKPVVEIPDNFPSRVYGEIPKDGDYVEVEISVSVIEDVGATLTYFKFEWDLDMDGNIDWVYYPSEGTRPPAAKKVYTKPGIYTARMYATDINGDVSTMDTQVIISKAVPPKQEPVSMPNYCLQAFLVFVLIIGLVWITANFNEVIKFEILTRIFVPLHKWHRKEIPKEDSIRRQINDYLSSKPGRYFSRVKLDLEIRSLLLARELMYLEDEGDAIHKRDGWHIRLISTRKPEKKKKPLKPWQKKVLKALIKRPWQSAAILAKKVGRSEPFVEGQLRRLEKKNLVVIRYDEEEGALYRAKIPGRKKGSYKRRKRPT